MTIAETHTTTPVAALTALLAGNQRFVAGTRIYPHQDPARRAALLAGQRPFAVLLGCSDSRVATETIFDCGLGDLFVVHTAGHVLGAEVLASLEYGVTVLGAPLLVVLGHESCGAIHAAMTSDQESASGLRPIIDGVAPSIEYANTRDVTDRDPIADVHIQRTIDLVTRQNTAIGAAVAAGRCGAVGMFYHLTDGRVTVVTTDQPARATTTHASSSRTPASRNRVVAITRGP